MKNNLFKFILGLCLLVLASSCGDEDYVEYNSKVVQEIADPYLQINTPVVSFQAGTPSYDIAFNAINGLLRLTDVKVYSTFTDAISGLQSEEVLLKTYPLDAGAKTEVTDMLTYADLKAGIVVNGEGLPADELALPIGSGWVLRFEGTSSQGPVGLKGAINVAVLSRFAGLYRVLESDYYRINVQSGIADWSGQERFIGSVDETTFSYNDFWGPFAWAGANFQFVLNTSDNTIDVPVIPEGGALFSGNRALKCADEPGLFVDVPCDGSNVLIIDDAGGKHVIKLTYGYFSDGSGSRQFYEVLEKIVD